MNIIVTGAAGFIGSNLVQKLLLENHNVVGIDNFSYGFYRNIKNVINHKKFKFLEHDLRDEKILTDLKAEIIVHLASQKIPRYSTALCTLNDNSKMLKNVIDKCLTDKIKLVFSSTSDVYGKNPNIPFHEESDLVMGPTTVKRWAYALSKIYSEQYIIANNQEFGLEYTIMRFFGSYGQNQNLTWWGGPQSVFIQNILENKPLDIHGDGKQTRTFTYIDDTIQGIIKCMFHENSKNDIFNIASEPNEEISILELAKLIWKLMKKNDCNINMNFVPYETFGKYEDVIRRVPSIDKIKTKLNYIPTYNIESGLLKTIKWQTALNNIKL